MRKRIVSRYQGDDPLMLGRVAKCRSDWHPRWRPQPA